MALELKWHGAEFQKQLNGAIEEGILRVGLECHKDMRLAVNKSNRRGKEPSKAGESPRKYTGFGQSGIVWEFDKQRVAARVGVTKNAIYMVHLELGTRARIIRPKSGRFLRIEWKGKVKPWKSKSKRKAKAGDRRYYLAIPANGSAFLVQKQDGKYWYYRPRVRHPGIRPRPFILKTVMVNKEKYGRLASTGGPDRLR